MWPVLGLLWGGALAVLPLWPNTACCFDVCGRTAATAFDCELPGDFGDGDLSCIRLPSLAEGAFVSADQTFAQMKTEN